MTKLSDTELFDKFGDILDDFGHKVVDNPGMSRLEVMATARRQFKDLFNSYAEAWADEANATGHWYGGTYGKDINGLELGHKCNCGFRASRKSSVEGHVEWKLAELRSRNHIGGDK